MVERRILVSMPYGSKSGSTALGQMTIDFDRVLRDVLRDAAPAGWSVFRFDEAAKPGEVAAQFMQILEQVEIAIFDITFANANVYYELGVRHTNDRAHATLLIAQRGTQPAFNVSHHQVWFYDYADPSSWPEFSAKLRSVLETAAPSRPNSPDSSQLRASLPTDELLHQVHQANNRSQYIALWNDWKTRHIASVAPLLELGRKLIEANNTTTAIAVAERAYELEPKRHDVVRTFGWYLRRHGDLERAETFLLRAVHLNAGDTEALGMLGGVYKRRRQWSAALDAYTKAAAIDPDDLYILVNLGALEAILNPADPNAGRVYYSRVIQLVDTRQPDERSVWDQLSLGEALLLVDGNGDRAEPEYQIAVELQRPSALQSAAEQLELFQRFGVVEPGASAILERVLRPALSRKRPAAANPSLPRSAATSNAAIVHLSDLHFGSRPSKDGKPKSMHRFGEGIHNRPLVEDIIGEVRRLLNEGRTPAQIFVVASGDIAYQARREEYEPARAFFDQLRSETGLPQGNLVIVPGNHDVSWAEPQGRFNQYIFFARRALGKERFEETHPHVDFDPEEQRWPDPSTLLGFYEHPAANLFFAGLNSCIRESDAKHFGLVGGNQLELLRKRLERVAPDCVRIAVLHHHVIPIDLQFEEVDGEARFDLSIVRDFGIVETQLQRLGFDLVLHGHKHMPALRESALRTGRDPKQGLKRLIVCGAGSASVTADELPPAIGNHLSVLRLRSHQRIKEKPFVDLEWRGLAYDATAVWQTQETWTLVG